MNRYVCILLAIPVQECLSYRLRCKLCMVCSDFKKYISFHDFKKPVKIMIKWFRMRKLLITLSFTPRILNNINYKNPFVTSEDFDYLRHIAHAANHSFALSIVMSVPNMSVRMKPIIQNLIKKSCNVHDVKCGSIMWYIHWNYYNRNQNEWEWIEVRKIYEIIKYIYIIPLKHSNTNEKNQMTINFNSIYHIDDKLEDLSYTKVIDISGNELRLNFNRWYDIKFKFKLNFPAYIIYVGSTFGDYGMIKTYDLKKHIFRMESFQNNVCKEVCKMEFDLIKPVF